MLDDQSIARRKQGKKTKRGTTVRPSLTRQRASTARRVELQPLLARLRAVLQIVALTGAVGALVAGVVLIGRGSPAAQALSRNVVPEEMQQAAATLPSPVTGEIPSDVDETDTPATVEFERTEDVEYVIAEGETLSEIASRYNLSYEALAEYNDLSDPHTLKPGQKIIIPRERRISDSGSTWNPTL